MGRARKIGDGVGDASSGIATSQKPKKICNQTLGPIQAFLSEDAGFPLSTLPYFVLTIGPRFVEGLYVSADDQGWSSDAARWSLSVAEASFGRLGQGACDLF